MTTLYNKATWADTYNKSVNKGIHPNFGAFIKQNFNNGFNIGDYTNAVYDDTIPKGGLSWHLNNSNSMEPNAVVGSGLGEKPSAFIEEDLTPKVPENSLYIPTAKSSEYDNAVSRFNNLTKHDPESIMADKPSVSTPLDTDYDLLGLRTSFDDINSRVAEVLKTDDTKVKTEEGFFSGLGDKWDNAWDSTKETLSDVDLMKGVNMAANTVTGLANTITNWDAAKTYNKMMKHNLRDMQDQKARKDYNYSALQNIG